MLLWSVCKLLSLIAFYYNRIINASLGIKQIQCERWTKRWTAFRILLYLDWSLLFIAPSSPVVPAVIAAPLLFNSPVSCWAC